MISQLLKQQTMPLHQEVETLNPLLDADFTVDHYKTYLSVLAAYYQAFERQFETLPFSTPPELELKDRLKFEKILADLKSLTTSMATLNFQVPKINSRADFWGHFYVLEGSTLGGQIIARKLAERLPLEETQLQFFHSYKERTGPMWKSFVEVLNNQDFTAEEQNAVLAAANQGFKSYGQMLQQIQERTSVKA